eukprot:2505022-Pyramimonas_sp.AAC.1
MRPVGCPEAGRRNQRTGSPSGSRLGITWSSDGKRHLLNISPQLPPAARATSACRRSSCEASSLRKSRATVAAVQPVPE